MPQVTLQQAFERAGELHRAGRLEEAASVYRTILTYQPDHAPTLHLLGVVCAQVGNHAEATRLIEQAIRADPSQAAFHANLGNVLQETGRLDEAIAAYKQALALSPGSPEIQNNLGNTLQRKGEFDNAILAYREALRLRPDFPEAHFNLANALQNRREPDEAIVEYRRAIDLRPGYGEAHLNLGIALLSRSETEQAIAAFGHASALLPASPEAPHNLGRVLQRAGRFDEAIEAFAQTLRLKPGLAVAEHDLGNALRETGRLEEAVAAYRRALALHPGFADAHYGLAWTLLLRGDLKQGWEEYEWRGRVEGAAQHARQFNQRRWDGSELAGQRILLYAEQGYGDSLFAFRYVPLVALRGGRVVVHCPRPLRRLLAGQTGIEQVVSDKESLPAFDVQCAVMSLPGRFGTTLETIPAEVPYIAPDASLAEVWRQRLGGTPGRRHIGLAWAGKPVPANRSIPFPMLAPLAQVPGIRFHSLQKGDAAREARRPQPEMDLMDWSEQIADFADTAALIANLDLVITIDTAVAHLAGAMGKPVWVLLQFVPDWRWLLHRNDSPWYPTMKLFRQPRPGDWASVISQVIAELRDFRP